MKCLKQLAKKVREMYPDDYPAPGITISYVDEERGWYVSAVRYPQGISSKEVIGSGGGHKLKDNILCLLTVLEAEEAK